MHRLNEIRESVEATHKGLGSMLAFNILAATANQCLINVAVAGIGKSTVTWTVKEMWKDETKVFDSITRSGLRYIADDISNYSGVVIIDDLGKVDTQYSRMATITSMAELCYSHFIRKMTYTIDIDIENFHGAALMNIQPVLMEYLSDRPEWEAVIRDKTIRYYHMIRPLKPEKELPSISLKRKRSVKKVRLTSPEKAEYYNLIQLGLSQWSYARCIEHINDLLRACAIIDDRMLVQEDDMQLLFELMKPMLLERWFMKKYAFESAIHFNDDAMCLLTEFCSFEPLTIAQLCVDFKIVPRTAHSILQNLQDWCYVDHNDRNVVKPTNLSVELLNELGFERKMEVVEEDENND